MMDIGTVAALAPLAIILVVGIYYLVSWLKGQRASNDDDNRSRARRGREK